MQRPAFERAGMRVTALFSRSAARATSLAAEHGITRGYDSVEALAAAADVDLVSVACPTSERKRHALAAVAAGKAVLVEKPMALARRQCVSTSGRFIKKFGDSLPRERER